MVELIPIFPNSPSAATEMLDYLPLPVYTIIIFK